MLKVFPHISLMAECRIFFTKTLATEAEPDILKNLAQAESNGVRYTPAIESDMARPWRPALNQV